ncbi:hypothetical protein BD309DRAFT_653362 [Dichomitus squalens]|nr:hypothetical protein BD309DRAFT_653362 [Dichomitus squalens]
MCGAGDQVSRCLSDAASALGTGSDSITFSHQDLRPFAQGEPIDRHAATAAHEAVKAKADSTDFSGNLYTSRLQADVHLERLLILQPWNRVPEIHLDKAWPHITAISSPHCRPQGMSPSSRALPCPSFHGMATARPHHWHGGREEAQVKVQCPSRTQCPSSPQRP